MKKTFSSLKRVFFGKKKKGKESANSIDSSDSLSNKISVTNNRVGLNNSNNSLNNNSNFI